MVLNIGFDVSVWSSLSWLFLSVSPCMWNLSIVLRWAPLLWNCTTCMVLLWFTTIKKFLKMRWFSLRTVYFIIIICIYSSRCVTNIW
jgi:hypothetical protein